MLVRAAKLSRCRVFLYRREETVNTHDPRKITIITGNKGEGKTTLIKKLVVALKAQGLVVQGLMSPGLFQGEKKFGIQLENLANGAVRQLASHEPGWDPTWPEREWTSNRSPTP